MANEPTDAPPSPRVRDLVADLVRTPLRWSHEDLLRNIDALERRCRDGEFADYSSREVSWLLTRVRQAQRVYGRREKRAAAALTACGFALAFFGTSTFFNLPERLRFTVGALFLPLAGAAYLTYQTRHELDLMAAALDRLHALIAATSPTRVRVDATPPTAHHQDAQPEREPDMKAKRRKR